MCTSPHEDGRAINLQSTSVSPHMMWIVDKLRTRAAYSQFVMWKNP
jgi:hypothetical protein